MINTQKFRKFNYNNKEKNLKVYGQEEPPEVDLNKITSAAVPIGIFVGLRDKIVNSNDVK